MTIMDKACYERGCACYDSRDGEEGVEAVAKREPLTDAPLYLSNLVTALDNAFISSWQSTHHWKKQLDEARDYLAAHGIKENT